MYKIILANAPCSSNNPKSAFVPLSLLVLGSCLKKIKSKELQFNYILVDLALLFKKGYLQDSPDFYMQAAKLLLEKNANACFFTVHGANIILVLRIAEKFKQMQPECLVAMGGLAPTLQARAIIENFPQIDVVIRGEAEPVLPSLVRAALNDQDFSKVPSIVFRSKGKVIENPRVCMSCDEEFPFPDYSLVDLKEYVEHNKSHPYMIPGYASVESGRGCSFHCTFCAPAKMWNRRVRYRPIPDIIKEMRFLVS